MINTAFRVLLTANATSLLVIIFLVQKGLTMGDFLGDLSYLGWTAFSRTQCLICFIWPYPFYRRA